MSRFARGLAMLALLAAGAAGAAPPSTTAQAEIERLLAELGGAPCEFFRNGSWHDAAAAQAHLRKKYDYLRDKGRIASAEDFIRGAATQSSVSGEAYQVRCAGQPAQPSADWLGAALRRLRAAPRPAAR